MANRRRISDEQAVLLALEYLDGGFPAQMGARIGVSEMAARAALMRIGCPLRSREESRRLAGRNISAGRKRWAATNAAGTSVKPNGYVEYTTGPNKGRAVHRVIAESMLGRPLREDEEVHHIDFNRRNNDQGNLQVLSKSAHARLHATARAMPHGADGRFIAKEC